jgi:hypothetical protein
VQGLLGDKPDQRICDLSRCCKPVLAQSVSLNGPIAQRLEQQTHNLLVPGSNPGGPTNQINDFRGDLVPAVGCWLRGGCILLRRCFAVEAINPIDISTGNQVPIGFDRHLNARVTHLFFHIG